MSSPTANSRPTILIRQAYREGGKAKKRTLSNITKLPPETVEKIREVLRGADIADAPAKLEDAFEISRSLQHGNAAAVLATLRACGIEQAIASRRSRSRDLAVALVAQRILEPGSKLAAARLFRPETAVSTLASQLGLPETLSEDRLYETMDWLLERQPRIEKALAEKHLSEGSPVLYDLTSVWSYSRTCPLVDRGYSRDGKKGLPQIEFGLLCDADGRPVAVEAFPGNASDPSTVAAQVGKLRDRFGLKRAVFVGDRGMAAQARVREDLEPNGYDWIFALRAAGVGALAAEGSLQPTLFDERDMAEIECRELFPGERLVVCRNPAAGRGADPQAQGLDRGGDARSDRDPPRGPPGQAAAPECGRDPAARRARPRQAQDAEAFRSEDRNGILLLEAQKTKYRRRGGSGRILRRSDQRSGRADVRRRRRRDLQEIGPGREGVPDDEGVRPPGPADPPPPRAEGPRPPPDLHARLPCRKAHARSARPDAVRRRARPGPGLARRQGRALAAGQAEGGLETHELGRGRPRLPGTARAARNAHDEPDRALGAGKAGIRRPRLADADPETGAAAAEREATVSRGGQNSGGIAAGAGRRGVVRVLPLRGCAVSDSSASDDEPGHRSGFLSFRVVRPFFVRGGAESVESLWTILIRAISRFRVRDPD